MNLLKIVKNVRTNCYELPFAWPIGLLREQAQEEATRMYYETQPGERADYEWAFSRWSGKYGWRRKMDMCPACGNVRVAGLHVCPATLGSASAGPRSETDESSSRPPDPVSLSPDERLYLERGQSQAGRSSAESPRRKRHAIRGLLFRLFSSLARRVAPDRTPDS